MRKSIIILLTILCSFVLHAQNPKWFKKSKLAQVSIVATDTEGLLHESQGVFLNEEGDVITDYDVIKKAVKASIFDSKGKEFKVTHIYGVSNMYNVAKLGIEKGKSKIAYLPQKENGGSTKEKIYILPHAKANKKALCRVDTIIKVDSFLNKYSYYTLSSTLDERQKSSPVLDEEGKLIGLIQLPVKEEQKSYIIDSRYGIDLEIRPLDAGNNDLNQICIPKKLPKNEEDALSYIFLLSNKEDSIYKHYLDDFKTKYPHNSTAYTLQAEFYAREKNFTEVENIINEGLNQEDTHKDEIHYSFSKLIYEFNLSRTDSSETSWTMERALSEIEKAHAINPLPVYTDQKALCLYALKKYNEAADLFLSLTKTNMKSVDLFLYAAQCKQMANAKDEEILSILDSAIHFYEKPYPPIAAKCFLLRGRTLSKMGKFREAVKDYNEYEHLFGGNLPSKFYYEREQLEVKCRMYPAAMNDIERAIKLSPNEPIFHAEYASLNYRVGQIQEAIAAAKRTIEIAPDYADPYRIIGVCYAEQKNYNEAKTYLKKAISLGDKLAEGVLKRISAEP